MNMELIKKFVPAELLDRYEIDPIWHTIKNPGKFEGETVATLYFYDHSLNGDGNVMEVSQEEKEAFDIDANYVYLAESNDGFVSLEFYDTRDEAEERETEEFGFDTLEDYLY